jgi:serine/threonine-protein kinase
VLVNDRYEVKIIDFGISKFHEVDLTRPHEYMGTLLYMTPETFIEGSKFADARTDIYALGHILYELEMGEHFWTRRGWTRLEQFAAYLSQTPPPISAIEFDDFEGSCYTHSKTAIAKMVTIDADQRIASVDAVLDLLGIRDIEPNEYEERISLGFPLFRVESGTNKDACLPLNLIDGENRVIGRGEIAGNDTSISRHHLEIRRQKAEYQIRDMGSTNGTLYCGNLLVADGKYVTLSHGDRLKLGDVFLRVEFSEVE